MDEPRAPDETPGAETGPPDCHGLSPASPGGAESDGGRGRANEAIAAALAAGKTVAEAAAGAGVSESTVYRRLRRPKFVARVRELRAAFVTAAAGRLASSMTAAADVLRSLLDSASDMVKLRAAERLLEIGVKVIELQELQARVEELERRLGEGGGA